MAKKDRSFAAKIRKSAGDFVRRCPVCGEPYRDIQYVSTNRSKKTGAWKFSRRGIAVCKCNEAEIYG